MKSRAKLVGFLLGLLLLAVETGALAHELEHQLQKPDATCTLCVFANHLGKTPVAVPHVFATCTPETYSLPVFVSAPRRQQFRAYAVHAPPLHFEIY